ncbi:MarR family winged helix-turn-helix transcriptional regulator [Celerinatantimonas sp. YJH-8]|uniref:MarR family winged helix-turn-helix transcriptional regulator n=1 Tax=Celerinatantimonas sp. YJH-8 TaxID=3228714 RepID=UPI0038C4BD55
MDTNKGHEIRQKAFYLMRLVLQQHTAVWQKAMPGITKPQYAVLRTVLDQPGIEQIQLMNAAASTKATLAELLNRLEKRGLVYRQADPNDRRRRFIFLTELGEQVLETAQPVAETTDSQFLARLDTEQRQQLVTLLM